MWVYIYILFTTYTKIVITTILIGIQIITLKIYILLRVIFKYKKKQIKIFYKYKNKTIDTYKYF